MIPNHDVVLGVILGGLTGLLFLPVFNTIWHWTWRTSPFTSFTVTALLASLTTLAASGAIFLGLSLPARPFVAHWRDFRLGYGYAFLICALIVRVMLNRRARGTSVGDRFTDRIRPITTIEADAGDVVFQRGEVEVRERPLIRIADDGKIIALGPAAAAAKGGRLVRLFPTDASIDDTALRAFCRYHLMLMSSISLRPRVAIVEPTFRKAFGPQAAAALERVLRADGFSADIVERKTDF